MMDLCNSAFLDLKEKNKNSIYFKTYFVSFRENGFFDMLYFTGGDRD